MIKPELVWVHDAEMGAQWAVYTDGAQVQFRCTPLRTDWLVGHPDIESIETEGDDVRLWLFRSIIDIERKRVVLPAPQAKPDRPADLVLAGPGESHRALWSRTPTIAHTEILDVPNDEEVGQDVWIAKVWLK